MKKVILYLTIVVMGIFLASSAYALPSLLTNQVTKMKFVNFENWVDNDGDDMISAGDDFYGIFNLTSIGDVGGDPLKTTWTYGGADEITGSFHLSVGDDFGSPLPPFSPPASELKLQFTMDSDDFITFYYDTTPDFDAKQSVANATADAEDGVVWFDISPGDYIDGYNVTSTTNSNNYNWADMTVNNTGYGIIPMLWKETLGSSNALGSYVADLYFETKLEYLDPTNPANEYKNWMFKSEDPVYLYAVPEPNTLLLFGFSLLGFAGIVRRKAS